MAFKKQHSFTEFREDILANVAAGRMHPSQAEELARQKGLKPFESKPDPTHYDINKVAIWSLEMVIAWLIWRNEAKVVLFYERFRENWIAWQFSGMVRGKRNPDRPRAPPRPLRTFVLDKCGPATLKDVDEESVSSVPNGRDINQPKLLLNYAEALNELIDHLVDGSLTAHGIKFETNRPFAIPAHEWRYLKLQTLGESSFAYMPPEPQPTYRKITFERSTVLSIWQSSKPDATVARARVGRPPVYDRDKIKRLAIEIINDEGGWDPVSVPQFNNAEICRRLYKLMGENGWKRQPSDSVLKTYVAEAIEDFLGRKIEK